jgi:hypothetical protein
MKEILDKTIGRFRIVGIQYTRQEMQKLSKKAEQSIKEYVKNCISEAYSDSYVGSPEDVSAGWLLAQHLRKKLRMPMLDCEAHEEEAYTMPEFSVYYNIDARSWCGKWTYSDDIQTYDEGGIFFALISPDEPEYKEIQDLLEYTFTENNNIAIAILERRLIE